MVLFGLFGAMSECALSADGEGVLEITVIDAASGGAVAARMRVRDEAGSDCVPADAVVVPIGGDKWFVGYGTIRLRVRSGQVSIRVERGTEYEPVKQSVTVEAGGVVKERIALRRWINMRQRGYVSGDNHLHVSVDKLPAMLAAEDLDFGTMLSWWNGPKLEVPVGREPVRSLEFGGEIIPTSIFDAEIEYAWGAVYIVGLPKPMALASDAGRANLAFVRAAHKQGALVCYQAGWSPEVLVDALAGYVDVVNVCNNNFHRHSFQPRKRYSNLLEVEGLPEYPNTAEGMLRMNNETYYRLLNCGLRLAAGAGSATGAKATPVGYNRAYVRAGKNAAKQYLQEILKEVPDDAITN